MATIEQLKKNNSDIYPITSSQAVLDADGNDIDTLLATKQDTIPDISTIRANAADGKAIATTIASYGDIVTHNVSEFATSAQGALAASALQKADITTGNANGNIRVKGTDIAVKGLLSAAFTSSAAYATAAQGTLAATALQPDSVKTINGESIVGSGDIEIGAGLNINYVEEHEYLQLSDNLSNDYYVTKLSGSNLTITLESPDVDTDIPFVHYWLFVNEGYDDDVELVFDESVPIIAPESTVTVPVGKSVELSYIIVDGKVVITFSEQLGSIV